jgi:lysylphosphatidylglycerol synthetase-like protein (DUF2156 family)
VASAVASTSRQVGSTLGVAVMGAVAGGTAAAALGAGFASATHAAWWITVGLGVTVVCLGYLTTTAWADRTAQATAELLTEGPRPRAAEPEQVGAAA